MSKSDDLFSAFTDAVTAALREVASEAHEEPLKAKAHAEIAALLLAQQQNVRALANSVDEIENAG